MFRGITGRILLPFILAGCALGIVYGFFMVIERRIPYIDFSRNSPVPRARRSDSEESLRFAVAAMLSAEESFVTYRKLVQKVADQVGKQEVFVLRPTYAEVRRALERGDVDVALICTGVYIHSDLRGRIQLLARPEFLEGREYRSALIVGAGSGIESLEQLRGRSMAYTDPESNTGSLVPQYLLRKRGEEPNEFFSEIILTGSHDRSIKAVALGTVDAAAVDLLVLESLKESNPATAKGVQILHLSESFAPPPVAVPAGLDEELKKSLSKALLNLHKDPDGRQILSEIGVRKFVPARPEDYHPVVEMRKFLESR